MARDGSGSYSLPAGNPVVTGTTISSTVQNNTMNDVAAALTQSVSKDGQTTMTGTLNMGTNAISNITTATGQKLVLSGGVAGPVLSVAAPSSGTAASISGVSTSTVLALSAGAANTCLLYTSDAADE